MIFSLNLWSRNSDSIAQPKRDHVELLETCNS